MSLPSTMRSVNILHLIILIISVQLTIGLQARTSSGIIRGRRLLALGRHVDVFLSIPYAEPPVGPLRLKKTVPIKPWTGVRGTDTFPPPCFQRKGNVPYVPWEVNEEESVEDCLFLNVWAPVDSPFALRPIMIWFHGGSFRIGGTNLKEYDGLGLAAYANVVVVTVNYRLGVLGFLNMNTSEAPGNMGLWDQHHAIKWVHENAKVFGGDPNSITIFGESAGAVAVGYHLMSPLSKGLVRRGILHSASPRWLQETGISSGLEKAARIARLVGCADEDVTVESNAKEVVDCLRRLPAEELTKAELEIFSSHLITFIASSGDELLPDEPTKAVDEGKFMEADILAGVNRDEGNAIVYMEDPVTFSSSCPKNLTSEEGRSILDKLFHFFPQEIRNSIADHYLHGICPVDDQDNIREAIAQSVGNFILDCPVVYFTESYGDKYPGVYFYLFSHRPTNSVWGDWVGATHFEEVQFVFGLPLLHPEKYSAIDMSVSRLMMNAWTSFARNGRPEPLPQYEWPNYSSQSKRYVDINGTHLVTKTGPSTRNCNFWKNVFRRSS